MAALFICIHHITKDYALGVRRNDLAVALQ
jgi:hypothetical protein